jgi:Uma2 family endonuclease
MSTVVEKVWTEEELMALPDDGRKYELVNGEIVTSNAGIEHEFIGIRLSNPLWDFVREHRLGIVCGSSAGYWMKSGNLRLPDVSFIAKERLQGLRYAPKKFFQGAPDLVVEILSPSDTVESLHEKIVEYFESGTRLLWVLNPEEQTVLVYHSPQPDRLLRPGDFLDGETIIPGFSMPVGELFAELEF